MPSSNDDDCATNDQIVERFEHDKDAGFELLMRKFGDMFSAICRKRVVQDHDLPDVQQEVSLEIMQLDKLPEPTDLEAWIQRLVTNVARRFARKRKAQPYSEIIESEVAKEAWIKQSRTLDYVEGAYRSPSSPLYDFIQKEIEKLKPIDQQILKMHIELGKDKYVAEAMKVLQKSDKYIRTHLSRIKKKISKACEAEGIAPSGVRVLDVIEDALRKLAPIIMHRAAGRAGDMSDREAAEIAKTAASDGDENDQLPASRGDAPTSTSRNYVSTGFPALDDLLGGKGLIQGATVLVRGQPGTGKTTLALQIAKHAINQKHDFVFASVEDEPAILLDQVTGSFWGQSHSKFLGDTRHWRVKDLTTYFDQEVRQKAEEKTVGQWCRDAKLSKPERNALIKQPRALKKLISHLCAEEAVTAAVRDNMKSMDVGPLLSQLWDALDIDGKAPIILVVDSLNALINGTAMRFQVAPDRQLMLAVLNSFRTWRRNRRGRVTVLFLVEEDSRIVNAAASYLADVVIELRSREVEQIIYESPGTPVKWSQEMRFCRVLKGRGLSIQGRSCGYEFVHDERVAEKSGIVFLPTYAAQGVVSLFYENTPMLEVIRALRMHDAPALFPQILVQEFNRSAQQRVFSVSRRRTNIALRHPMMLSNIDEYWLKRLKEHDLIQPIPASELKIFSLEPKDYADGADGSPFIKELADAKKHIFLNESDPERLEYFGVPQIANVGMLVYRKDLLEKVKEEPPETWDDVERICDALKNHEDHPPSKLYVELASYDTFLATALELGWGHGAMWKTVQQKSDDPQSEKLQALRIEFDDKSHVAYLVAALMRLKRWIFELQIVPKQCTVDPDVEQRQDWVFARHWYSTWINVCTHDPQVLKSGVYGILPIPIDAAYKRRAGETARHHSAWGEWYLALLRGSENIQLGIELINNLMTARKVTERARSGAALPTSKRFYELSDEDCPETDLTFNELKKLLFTDAKSRSEFDDYPRVARIFSAVLRTITTNERADVVETVRKGFEFIDREYTWPPDDDINERLAEIFPKLPDAPLQPPPSTSDSNTSS